MCLIPEGFSEYAADGAWRRDTEPPLDRDVIGWVQRPAGQDIWHPRAGRGVMLVTRGKASKDLGLAEVSPGTGAAQVLFEIPARWEGATYGIEALNSGSACYLMLEAAHHPPELWRVNLAGFSDHADGLSAECIFKLNPAQDSAPLGTGRIIEYRAQDGEIRRATLLLPPNYSEAKRLPVIVEVYGGGIGSEAVHVFGGSDAVLNWHLLSARGYAVLYPDMPLQRGEPMRQLSGLVLPAVDKLIDIGIADPSRLGLMGQSYGGYTTVALITQTKRFRAAVATAGMVDLVSHYGTVTDLGDSQWTGWAENGQGGVGGNLWEKRDAFIENSPLFYFDRVETPLMLVCGTRHPEEAAQACEAFNALRRLNKPVEMRLYENEDHWPGMWSEGAFRDMCAAITGWFDKYLAVPEA